MKTLISSAQMLGVAIAASSLFVLASGRNLFAGTIPPSDELLVLGPTGGPLQDTLVPETTGTGTESSALFAPGTGLAALEPPGALTALAPGPIAGAFYVILSEPPTEPIDPTELPPVVYAGPNGPVVVSDLLVNGLNNQAGLPPFIAFVSDNNPDLAFAVSKIPAGTAVPVVLETGGLQDLTALMGPSTLPGVGPLDVQVRSDVTFPEPSSIVILLGFVGAGLIGFIQHRRRTA